MTTLFEKQGVVAQAYDRTIAALRRQITKRGARPVAVLVTATAGDGIQGAIRRRKQVHHTLYHQLCGLQRKELR